MSHFGLYVIFCATTHYNCTAESLQTGQVTADRMAGVIGYITPNNTFPPDRDITVSIAGTTLTIDLAAYTYSAGSRRIQEFAILLAKAVSETTAMTVGGGLSSNTVCTKQLLHQPTTALCFSGCCCCCFRCCPPPPRSAVTHRASSRTVHAASGGAVRAVSKIC